MSAYLIDTHAHLYDEAFDNDREAMVQRALDAGVTKMLLPNCDQATIEPMMQLVAQWPQHMFPMMGLHPTYVKEDYEVALNYMHDLLNKQTFYAIGEIGLDYYWDETFVDAQKAAFATQINWANDYSLPIVIHSRSATQDCIDLVNTYKTDQLKGVFHCFSGTVEEALQVKSLGFYLGIGGVVTYKKTNLPEVIQAVGIDSLVLETDAPYLGPVPFRGKRNESAYTTLVAEKLVDVLQLPLAQIIEHTTANAEHLFNLNK